LRLALGAVDIRIVGPGEVPGRDFTGWVIVNYDILKRHADALRALPFAGIVFDEAHYLKNHRPQRSIVSRQLIDRASTEPVVHVLTGTPLTNRPRDLFPLLQLVNHSLGRSFLAFARRYCDATRNEYGRWLTGGSNNIQELSIQLLGVMLRRRKDDVLDLPAKHRNWIELDVAAALWHRLNAQVAELLAEDAPRNRRGSAAASVCSDGSGGASQWRKFPKRWSLLKVRSTRGRKLSSIPALGRRRVACVTSWGTIKVMARLSPMAVRIRYPAIP